MCKASENNAVVLCGTVESDPTYDHTLFGEPFYQCRLAVPRLSGVEDVLPVVLPGRMPAMPAAGDTVRIGGQLRSYKKQYETGNRLLLSVFTKQLDFCAEDAPENSVELYGFLCKPAVFRTTPFMREIADVLLAVNRMYNKSDYLPCIAWGRNARYARDIPVGAPVHVQGRLQSRSYVKTLQDGVSYTRVTYEVSCTSIEEA